MKSKLARLTLPLVPFFLSVAPLILSGCAESPRIDVLPDNAVIVAFGDSLTAGTGAHRSRSYPALLADITGYEVINAGVPGEVSASGLARLPGLLRRHRPHLVILCHGGNDILKKFDEALLAQNLNAMIETIRAEGADVILVGVPKPGLLLDTASVYEETAERQGIPCESRIVAHILSTPSLKSDTIHPNAEGYGRMARALASLIIECQAR